MTQERFEEITKQLQSIQDEVQAEGGAIVVGIIPDMGNNSESYTSIRGRYSLLSYLSVLLARMVSDAIINDTQKPK